MHRFNGVTTKYLNSYIKWFKWLYTFNSEKDTMKAKNFIIQNKIPYNYIKIVNLKNLKPILI